MKLARSLLAIWLMAVPVLALDQVPASMVRVTTNGWGQLPGNTNLQGVLDWVDDNIASATNYAPRSMTNTNPQILTPRWPGDLLVITGTSVTNTQVWTSWGVASNSWLMIFPVQMRTSTDTAATNTPPRYVGDMLEINGASTNILWLGNGLTATNWKAIYRGLP